jgi:hypothetical protein
MPIAVPPTTQTPRVKSGQLIEQGLTHCLEAACEGREILHVGHAKDHMGVALTEDVLVHARRALARNHHPTPNLRPQTRSQTQRRKTAERARATLLVKGAGSLTPGR